MIAADSLGFGTIVPANIPDPDGDACDHPHPAMILSGPDCSGKLYLIGISSKFDRAEKRLMIKLPWAPSGHPITGLDRECVLKYGGLSLSWSKD